MRRCDTEKPAQSGLGLGAAPVAPSSRISPPEPVAAPGNGEIAVGWLCVSTFIRMCVGSRARRSGRPRVRIEAAHRRAFHDRRVVRIGDDRALRDAPRACGGSCRTGSSPADAVDDPVGVEDLVPAMLGVGLREHHQLDVGRIAADAAEIRVADSRSRLAPARVPVRALAAPSRARPRASSGIVVSGCGAKCANSAPRIQSSRRAPSRSCGRGGAAAAPRDRAAASGAPSRGAMP